MSSFWPTVKDMLLQSATILYGHISKPLPSENLFSHHTSSLTTPFPLYKIVNN